MTGQRPDLIGGKTPIQVLSTQNFKDSWGHPSAKDGQWTYWKEMPGLTSPGPIPIWGALLQPSIWQEGDSGSGRLAAVRLWQAGMSPAVGRPLGAHQHLHPEGIPVQGHSLQCRVTLSLWGRAAHLFFLLVFLFGLFWQAWGTLGDEP